MQSIPISLLNVSVFTTQEAIKDQQGAKERRFLMFILDMLFRTTNVSFESKNMSGHYDFSTHTCIQNSMTNLVIPAYHSQFNL
jgi:hypothetical protein